MNDIRIKKYDQCSFSNGDCITLGGGYWIPYGVSRKKVFEKYSAMKWGDIFSLSGHSDHIHEHKGSFDDLFIPKNEVDETLVQNDEEWKTKLDNKNFPYNEETFRKCSVSYVFKVCKKRKRKKTSAKQASSAPTDSSEPPKKKQKVASTPTTHLDRPSSFSSSSSSSQQIKWMNEVEQLRQEVRKMTRANNEKQEEIQKVEQQLQKMSELKEQQELKLKEYEAKENHVLKIQKKIRETITCRLCNRIISRSVTIPCGHKFCFSCFRDYCENHSKPMFCPICQFNSRNNSHLISSPYNDDTNKREEEEKKKTSKIDLQMEKCIVKNTDFVFRDYEFDEIITNVLVPLLPSTELAEYEEEQKRIKEKNEKDFEELSILLSKKLQYSSSSSETKDEKKSKKRKKKMDDELRHASLQVIDQTKKKDKELIKDRERTFSGNVRKRYLQMIGLKKEWIQQALPKELQRAIRNLGIEHRKLAMNKANFDPQLARTLLLQFYENEYIKTFQK